MSSLAGLPTELFDDIVSRLPRRALCKLARSSKALYNKAQNPLYYHAYVNSAASLALLQRTVTEKARYDGMGGVISKNIKTLRITIEAQDGERATLPVIARILQSLSRYCPSLKIFLCFANANCCGAPVNRFGKDELPKVTTLKLDMRQEQRIAPASPPQAPARPRPRLATVVGARHAAPPSFHHSLAPDYDTACEPKASFWHGLFSGTTFPDLEQLEVYHTLFPLIDYMYAASSAFRHIELEPDGISKLAKLTRLSIRGAPEISDSILFSCLTHAISLKELELSNLPYVTPKAYEKLLQVALPRLFRFILHYQGDDWPRRPGRNEAPHLCPIIRDYSKNLPFLDLMFPTLCRGIFLTPDEASHLGKAGRILGMEQLDKQLYMRELRLYREGVEKKELTAATAENMSKNPITKSGHVKTEALAWQEEEGKLLDRKRLIKKEGWTRILRARRGLCGGYESEAAWDEFSALAELECEKEGMTWIIGNKGIEKAISYVDGSPPATASWSEMWEGAEPEVPPQDRFTPNGFDLNDQFAGN